MLICHPYIFFGEISVQILYPFSFLLCWVFAAMHGFFLVVSSGGYSFVEEHRLQSVRASVVVVHGTWKIPQDSVAGGIFPD